MSSAARDTLGRPLGSLRISVTDRCNVRCAYCMPEADYVWLPKPRILRFEEIDVLVDAFLDAGVTRLRLTGGEPLLRRELDRLVEMLARKERVRDLALTTNAVLLGEQADALARAGLHRITASLDTLRRERYRELTRRDELPRVLAGLEAAGGAGFRSIKLNCVVMRGRNDDELEELLAFARAAGHELRFIEYMDVGGATAWSEGDVLPRDEILARIQRSFGPVEEDRPADEDGRDAEAARRAPAERFRLADGTRFGVIASTTAPFCRTCDRARLTADGHWFTCLYAREGLDLGRELRAGATRAELAELVAKAWSGRRDRGAEERLEDAARTRLAAAEELRGDPHLEMHTRGG